MSKTQLKSFSTHIVNLDNLIARLEAEGLSVSSRRHMQDILNVFIQVVEDQAIVKLSNAAAQTEILKINGNTITVYTHSQLVQALDDGRLCSSIIFDLSQIPDPFVDVRDFGLTFPLMKAVKAACCEGVPQVSALNKRDWKHVQIITNALLEFQLSIPVNVTIPQEFHALAY